LSRMLRLVVGPEDGLERRRIADIQDAHYFN
jgi:hypothetical protein